MAFRTIFVCILCSLAAASRVSIKKGPPSVEPLSGADQASDDFDDAPQGKGGQHVSSRAECEGGMMDARQAAMDRIQAFFGPACSVEARHMTVAEDAVISEGEHDIHAVICTTSCQGHDLLQQPLADFGELKESCIDAQSQMEMRSLETQVMPFHAMLMAAWSECVDIAVDEAQDVKPIDMSGGEFIQQPDVKVEPTSLERPAPPKTLVKKMHLAWEMVQSLSNHMSLEKEDASKANAACLRLMRHFDTFDQDALGQLTTDSVNSVLKPLSEYQLVELQTAFTKVQSSAKNPDFVTFEDIVHQTFGWDDETACLLARSRATR